MVQARQWRHVSAAACLATAYFLALLWSLPARADGGGLEYAVKATYLYKLAAFVTWPSSGLPLDAFVICVVGPSPVGTLLDRAVKGQTVQQRPVVVRRYASVISNPGCQMMYVAGSGVQRVADVLAAVRGAPVLTVTDGQDAAGATGIINFVVMDGRVRFEIDEGAAAENGLVISSKLLSLAVRVNPRRAG